MRNVLPTALLVGVAACAGDAAQPLAPFAPLTSLAASPSTVVSRTPFTSAEYNSCVPEWIQFSGTLTSLSHVTGRPGLYQVVVHWQFNIAGVGLTSGDTYRVSRLYHEVINQLSLANAPYEDHLVQQVHLVRESDGASYTLRNVWQVTVNAIGEVSVQLDEWSITC